ncbi:MAG: response regulator [Acidobacteriota bacterium]|nr:response regulator [Acidobacteriota bacterium]
MNAELKTQGEELLADFRHRLRTPLNHIIGYSDLLLEDPQGMAPDNIRQLENIRGNAHLILEQVQHRLVPGDHPGMRQKMEALRSDITDPLHLIIAGAGKLSQQLHGGPLRDVLRIAAAGRELLTFMQNADGMGRVGNEVLRTPDFQPVAIQSIPSRLLVVDDDKTNCEVLQRQLVRGGHTVTCVCSGDEALELLRDPAFDLVLLDVMMPGTSGFDLLQRLKSCGTLGNIPVIMMSALDELEIAAHCIQMGAEDYLLKPFDPVLLRARLHSALERKRLQQAASERTGELEKATQSLARANEDLNRFAFAASHDLQEPLRTITNTLQLLARELPATKQNSLLDLAIDGARRMSHLIRDLLAYSVATSCERVQELVDVEAVLAETLTNLRQSIEESGARVTHDPLPAIVFDRAQLGQVFQNLTGNAIKYRGERVPEIHVTVIQNDQHWVFSVRDNGIGIEEQYRQTIFEPFRRLHGRDLPGTGLGLAICARIVEGFGGRIWVDSKPGAGSTFFFTVKRQEVKWQEAAAEND